jgi:hypothetical protein
VKKLRLNRKVYLTIALVLIMVTAGWLVYNHKDLLIAKLSSDRILKKDSPPNMGNPRAGLKYEPKQTETAGQLKKLPKIPVRKKIIKSQGVTISGQTRPLPKPVPSKSRISRSQLADPKKPVRNQSRAAVRPPTQRAKSPLKQVSKSYRRLDDSKLKLQAIAWSNDVAQRIAVINGHIVREGESVEGFSVTQIRQDDIIVNDGTESWRLEFGLK